MSKKRAILESAFSPSSAMYTLLEGMQMDRATGSDLDTLGANMAGLTRAIGESDARFRARLIARLGGAQDSDAEFADKIRGELLPELLVPCPKCGAVRGDSCETPDGADYKSHYFHQARTQQLKLERALSDSSFSGKAGEE